MAAGMCPRPPEGGQPGRRLSLSQGPSKVPVPLCLTVTPAAPTATSRHKGAVCPLLSNPNHPWEKPLLRVSRLPSQWTGVQASVPRGQPCGHWGWVHFRSRQLRLQAGSGHLVFRPGWWQSRSHPSSSICLPAHDRRRGRRASSATLPASPQPEPAGWPEQEAGRGHAPESTLRAQLRAPEDPVSEDVQAFRSPGVTLLVVRRDASLEGSEPSACCGCRIWGAACSSCAEGKVGENQRRQPSAGLLDRQAGRGPRLPSGTWPLLLHLPPTGLGRTSVPP